MLPLGCEISAFKEKPSSRSHETVPRKQRNERKTKRKRETIDNGTKGDFVATSAVLRPLETSKYIGTKNLSARVQPTRRAKSRMLP